LSKAKASILVVDDEEQIRTIVSRRLQEDGYTCVQAPNGSAALNTVSTQTFDVVLLDIKMPGPSGIEVLPQIIAQSPETCVIMATAIVDTQTAIEAMKLGAYDYITKPFDLDDLGMIIEKALLRKRSSCDHGSDRVREVEEALQESEDKYREVVERASDGIAIVQDLIIKYANPRSSAIIGYSPQELIDTPMPNYIHPNELQKILKKYKRRLAGENPDSIYETKLIHKNGDIIDVEMNAGLIHYEGRPADLVIVRDISERKKTAEALKQSEQNYKTLFESTLDSLVVVNAITKKAMLCNQNFANLCRADSIDQVIGHHVFDFLHPDERDHILTTVIDDILDNCQRKILDFHTRKKDGNEIWISAVGTRIKYHGETAVLISVRDITERKQVDGELKHTVTELERSNADLEQFAYIASHDLQEPLRVAANYIELLQRRYKGKLDDDANDFIGYAVNSIERMFNLIDDLLEYSRVSRYAKPFTTVSSNSLVNQAISNLKASIDDSNATITQDKLPNVTCDESQLIQVFQNLLSNAIKFRRKESPHIHISAERTDSAWQFSIQDNGIGIKSEHLDRIFIMFKRLYKQEEYPGTGVGLAICKKIIERHGGRIWVESEPDKGSTFYFTIPDKGNV